MAFEKLDHIRKRISNASKYQQWAFRRIQEYAEYNAAENGIAVEKVGPSTPVNDVIYVDCSFTYKDNRDGDEFECLKCGRAYHADYNAAKNIARKLPQNWHTSGSGGASSQPCPEVGDVERERHLHAYHCLVVRTGVHRQALPFSVEVVAY